MITAEMITIHAIVGKIKDRLSSCGFYYYFQDNPNWFIYFPYRLKYRSLQISQYALHFANSGGFMGYEREGKVSVIRCCSGICAPLSLKRLKTYSFGLSAGYQRQSLYVH